MPNQTKIKPSPCLSSCYDFNCGNFCVVIGNILFLSLGAIHIILSNTSEDNHLAHLTAKQWRNSVKLGIIFCLIEFSELGENSGSNKSCPSLMFLQKIGRIFCAGQPPGFVNLSLIQIIDQI